MGQVTLRDPEAIYAWIETHDHHEVGLDESTRTPHIFLKGHGHQLRVPQDVWKTLSLRLGGEFDTRFYRRRRFSRGAAVVECGKLTAHQSVDIHLSTGVGEGLNVQLADLRGLLDAIDDTRTQ